MTKGYHTDTRCQTILNSMMQKHLPEVFEFIRETGNFDADMDSDSSDPDQDLNVTEPEDNRLRIRIRGPALSSPPQTRPITASATAQSSAALRGALSPRAASSQLRSPGNAQYAENSPLRRSPIPPPQPAPVTSPGGLSPQPGSAAASNNTSPTAQRVVADAPPQIRMQTPPPAASQPVDEPTSQPGSAPGS